MLCKGQKKRATATVKGGQASRLKVGDRLMNGRKERKHVKDVDRIRAHGSRSTQAPSVEVRAFWLRTWLGWAWMRGWMNAVGSSLSSFLHFKPFFYQARDSVASFAILYSTLVGRNSSQVDPVMN